MVLAAWQICASTGVVDANFSSSPFGAFSALIDSITDRRHVVAARLDAVDRGLGHGASRSSSGIPLGLLIGRSRILFGLTDPIISIMYSVPYVVFLPMLIFWFGIGINARIVIVVWSALFPLLINVIAGARNLDPSHLQVPGSSAPRGC